MSHCKNLLWLLLSLVIGCRSLLIKEHHPNIALKMIAQPQIAGPCIASLIGPPTKNCIQWQANVDASPTFEPARRLIFTGAADHFLHVLDADGGYAVAQIATSGRVITDAVFAYERTVLYVGTDKGVIHAFDAFSFEPLFCFNADGKINNNLTVVKDNTLAFTSAMGSIYYLDGKTGALKWEIKIPLSAERLRLSFHSSILVHEETLVVPHADGFLSIVDFSSGKVRNKISFGPIRPNSFPDIIAPMVALKNRLWVASYDLGLFGIDLSSMQIREHFNFKEIVQLNTDGTTLFAATPNILLAISESGKLKWQNNLMEIETRMTRTGYQFSKVPENRKRIFFGTPSRLLLHENLGVLIMGTSAGSLGIFDKGTGRLRKILGNSVGFGPKIDWAGAESFITVSKRGLLMKFQFAEHGMLTKDPYIFWTNAASLRRW